MTKTPSIFNDVIGPVMRGPSSSHTAASWRIARSCLDILKGNLQHALIEFDKNGAWATNYREQGTVMGIHGGLLAVDMTDDRMKHLEEIAIEKGIHIEYRVTSFQNDHPNTVKLTLTDDLGEKVVVVGVSLGGGSFELRSINGYDLRINGENYELLIMTTDEKVADRLQQQLAFSRKIEYPEKAGHFLIHQTLSSSPDKNFLKEISKQVNVENVILINPVMPVLGGNLSDLPFDSVPSMLEYAEEKSMDLGEIGLLYEHHRSGLDKLELQSKMDDLIKIMENSISVGLKGTSWHDRILPQQSHLIEAAEKKSKIISDSVMNNIIANVTAIMESKSAMEVVVANPTAGSCGTVAGALKAVTDKLDASREDIIKAYFAAGIVGVWFAKGPGFAAEEHGCQVECGASAGMAAAAIVQLQGGTARQAVNAASQAIQNMIGLVCDPVGDRVEVPCLGKNVSAAVNAFSSATMILAGFDAVIPYDQVLETVERVGNLMPGCHKCTGTGGLAITPAAKKLKLRLEKLQLNEK